MMSLNSSQIFQFYSYDSLSLWLDSDCIRLPAQMSVRTYRGPRPSLWPVDVSVRGDRPAQPGPSMCCCPSGATWPPPPGASSPARCAPRQSRRRGHHRPPPAYLRVLDELISQHSTPSSATREQSGRSRSRTAVSPPPADARPEAPPFSADPGRRRLRSPRCGPGGNAVSQSLAARSRRANCGRC
jgi:hypothetical protein